MTKAVWGNCHQVVLKQVRQQAVTGGKRSVIDGQSLVDVTDSWKFLHCISVCWKTKKDRLCPADAIYSFNPSFH